MLADIEPENPAHQCVDGPAMTDEVDRIAVAVSGNDGVLCAQRSALEHGERFAVGVGGMGRVGHVRMVVGGEAFDDLRNREVFPIADVLLAQSYLSVDG